MTARQKPPAGFINPETSNEPRTSARAPSDFAEIPPIRLSPDELALLHRTWLSALKKLEADPDFPLRLFFPSRTLRDKFRIRLYQSCAGWRKFPNRFSPALLKAFSSIKIIQENDDIAQTYSITLGSALKSKDLALVVEQLDELFPEDVDLDFGSASLDSAERVMERLKPASATGIGDAVDPDSDYPEPRTLGDLGRKYY